MIKLIKKYPYDNSYDYVKLFDSKSKQQEFFNSFSKITISDEDTYGGYIKEGQTFIVNYNYDYLVNENVNYIIFNNGYKNIYAFIIRKEYVDEENTRLYYEIDVMNTFCFDFNIKKSYVERKVCSMSEIADFDEGMTIGEHVIESNYKCFDKSYTYFSMWKGFISQMPSFKDNGEIDKIVELPYASVKPFCYIDNIQYPIFFSPMKEIDMYEQYTTTDIANTPSGEIIGEGILPVITNSLGQFMIPTTGTITALYPRYPSGGAHTGVDIANVQGTPIYADRGGTVEIVNRGNQSYGLYAKITHSDGTMTILGHMSSVLVKTGDTVITGQQIGKMGSTGNSTGNHLHWEIRDANNNHVHPYPDAVLYHVIKKKESDE